MYEFLNLVMTYDAETVDMDDVWQSVVSLLHAFAWQESFASHM